MCFARTSSRRIHFDQRGQLIQDDRECTAGHGSADALMAAQDGTVTFDGRLGKLLKRNARVSRQQAVRALMETSMKTHRKAHQPRVSTFPRQHYETERRTLDRGPNPTETSVSTCWTNISGLALATIDRMLIADAHVVADDAGAPNMKQT